jgi:hypothetical protein
MASALFLPTRFKLWTFVQISSIDLIKFQAMVLALIESKDRSYITLPQASGFISGNPLL